jgi:hypothetical protein
MKIFKTAALAMALSGLAWSAATIQAAEEPLPYSLNTCVVSGEKFGGDMKPYSLTYEGREIKLCCKGCATTFEKDRAGYLKKIEAAEKKAVSEHPYPLKTCLVTGEELGGMGKPYSLVYEEKEVQLCCKGCLKAFKKEPAKFMKKMASAKK